MRSIHILFTCLLLPGVAWAQTSSANPDSSADDTNLATEVKTLRDALLQTQRQMAVQQREIDRLKAQSKDGATRSSTNEPTPSPSEIAAADWATSSVEPSTEYAGVKIKQQTPTQQLQGQGNPEQAPLGSLRVGSAVLELGGFVDLENIFRTTNTQSNIATNFAGFPYGNTPQGRVTEFRTTAQFSRLSFKIQDHFAGNDVMGFVEGDFSGNDSPGVYQSVNPLTNRLRLYFMDLKRGKWEVLGGQTWSWLTPNREGIGPMPSDLAITYNEDQNLGVGVPYTRAAEFRVAYHANKHWAFGAGIENPNQFIGSFVALPAAYPTIGPQFDNGAQIGGGKRLPRHSIQGHL
jgi:hypothetical protein